MARFWEIKENGTRENTKASSLCPIRWKKSKREPFCRPLETKFSERVAPLRKRNERMWANEIHVQVPKHSWQFPRVIGSWLRGVFYPQSNASNLSSPRAASRGSAGPDSLVQRIRVRVRARTLHPRIVPFRDSDFIVTLSSPTTLNVTYRNFDFPHTR